MTLEDKLRSPLILTIGLSLASFSVKLSREPSQQSPQLISTSVPFVIARFATLDGDAGGSSVVNHVDPD